MLKEFKEFAMRGNVVDMAVGIIIGAAFGAIVKSLVADVIVITSYSIHYTKLYEWPARGDSRCDDRSYPD